MRVGGNVFDSGCWGKDVQSQPNGDMMISKGREEKGDDDDDDDDDDDR